jgi:hypothetical protein
MAAHWSGLIPSSSITVPHGLDALPGSCVEFNDEVPGLFGAADAGSLLFHQGISTDDWDASADGTGGSSGSLLDLAPPLMTEPSASHAAADDIGAFSQRLKPPATLFSNHSSIADLAAADHDLSLTSYHTHSALPTAADATAADAVTTASPTGSGDSGVANADTVHINVTPSPHHDPDPDPLATLTGEEEEHEEAEHCDDDADYQPETDVGSEDEFGGHGIGEPHAFARAAKLTASFAPRSPAKAPQHVEPSSSKGSQGQTNCNTQAGRGIAPAAATETKSVVAVTATAGGTPSLHVGRTSMASAPDLASQFRKRPATEIPTRYVAAKRQAVRRKAPGRRLSGDEDADVAYRPAARRHARPNAANGASMDAMGVQTGVVPVSPPCRASRRLQGRASSGSGSATIPSDFVTYEDDEDELDDAAVYLEARPATSNERIEAPPAKSDRMRSLGKRAAAKNATAVIARKTGSSSSSRAGKRTVPLAAQRIRATSARHELKGRPSFAEIVEAGFMRPGPHRFNVGNVEVAAMVGNDGAITYAGTRYRAISKFALMVLRERNPTRQSCDGWKEVALNGEKLDVLRLRVQQAQRAAGRMRTHQ